MKIGRNAPCPCGSGKKYKKCCLDKDEAARQTPQTLAPSQPLPEAPPPHPQVAAVNTRWDAFEEATYEERMAIFTQTLDEPELMDDEMAFHMLDKLYIATYEHDQRDRFDALVETLRARLPEVYEAEAHYCLHWHISNALVTERFNAVPSLVREFAAIADQDIDVFNQTLDQLANTLQNLQPLVPAMCQMWENRTEDPALLRGLQTGWREA